MNTSNHTSHSSNQRGFTLVEIMIVVVIIGILASMAAVAFKHVRERAIATRVAMIFGYLPMPFKPTH